MTTSFSLAVRTSTPTFKDTASVGDVNRYSIDATPWAEDSGVVSSVASSVEDGSVSITNETLVAGVWSADITMLSRGRAKIGILFNSGTVKKKAYLKIKVNDNQCGDDYGQGCC